MIFEHLDRIIFAGDSVTDMGSAGAVSEGLFDALGHGYVRMIDNMLEAWYPERMIRVTNAGISGNTSADLLARWQRDILNLHPQWVSICIGFNDVWRQFDSPTIPDQHIPPEQYEKNVEQMILSVRDQVKGIILMTPFYLEPLKEDRMRARMDEYGAVCRRLAEKYGCIFVDLQAMFDRYFVHRHSASIAWDRVHPNEIGASLIAREFLQACGFDFAHQA